MAYKERIKLMVTTKDSVSTSEIKSPNVTPEMFDAAIDLIFTMSTGKRRISRQFAKEATREAKKAAKKTKR